MRLWQLWFSRGYLKFRQLHLEFGRRLCWLHFNRGYLKFRGFCLRIRCLKLRQFQLEGGRRLQIRLNSGYLKFRSFRLCLDFRLLKFTREPELESRLRFHRCGPGSDRYRLLNFRARNLKLRCLEIGNRGLRTSVRSAPFPPHLLISRLNRPCERCSVAQRRTLKPLAQGRSKSDKPVAVARKLNSFGNIVRLGFRDQSCQPDPLQDARTNPCHMAISAYGYHRSSHPQRFKSGCRAIVRKGIKADIYPVIKQKMFLPGRNPWHHRDTLGRNAVLCKKIKISFPG